MDIDSFLKDLADIFDKDVDALPAICVEVEDVGLEEAEPDVGIMSGGVADYTWDGNVGDEDVGNNPDLFAKLVCEFMGQIDASTEARVHNLLIAELEGQADDMADAVGEYDGHDDND